MFLRLFLPPTPVAETWLLEEPVVRKFDPHGVVVSSSVVKLLLSPPRLLAVTGKGKGGIPCSAGTSNIEEIFELDDLGFTNDDAAADDDEDEDEDEDEENGNVDDADAEETIDDDCSAISPCILNRTTIPLWSEGVVYPSDLVGSWAVIGSLPIIL
jgi:hypothetical protein